MMVDIRLQSEVPSDDAVEIVEPKNLVTPGSIITRGTDFMRGHGTYMQDDCLHSSVAGVVERVNSLISVRPLKSRYHGEIGDVVIGRITEVVQKRWKLETNARLDSILLLTSVNLPGGELRRRSAEDELAMRQYLKEGDLVSAEVQNIFGDGALSLHTRSMKYGKLSQGFLLKVNPSLIRRQKNHFHNLPCGASMILGNNGYVWICPTLPEDTAGGFVQDLEKVQMSDRLTISRLRNCVAALAQSKIMIFETSILYAYEASLQLGYEVKDLLLPDKISELALLVRNRFELERD